MSEPQLDSSLLKDKKAAYWAWESLVGLVLSILILIAQGLIFKWEPIDDAYITFRYAQNLAEGHGLVFNLGHRVEGYTNFLWTVILAAVAWFKLDVPQVSKWLGVFFASVGLVLTWRLALCVVQERNWPKSLVSAPPIILAFYPGWSYWAFSGMEGPLLTCLVLAFFLVGCKPTASIGMLFVAGGLGFLAAMTRWEAMLLWPVAVMFHLCDSSKTIPQRLKRSLILAAVLLTGFGIYFVSRFSYYGELMPNTYWAKMGGTLINRLVTGTVYTGELTVEWLLLLTFLLWFVGPLGQWTVILASSLVIYVGYVTWTGGDTFAWLRFYLPILPIAAIMVTHTIECVVAAVARTSMKNLLRVVLTLAAALTIAGIALRIDYRAAKSHLDEVRGWQKVGLWAQTNFPKGYRIALAPIGAVGYYSQKPVVDILGLTDYEIAHFGKVDMLEPPAHQRYDIDLVIRRRPEVVLGQALLFPYRPDVEYAIAHSARRALKAMYRRPEFRALYRYEVAQIGQLYLPYWIDQTLNTP